MSSYVLAAFSGPVLEDVDLTAGWYQIEQGNQVLVPHADATVRAGLKDIYTFWRAMDINVSSLGIDRAEAVKAGFFPAEPQDACQNPVPVRVGLVERIVKNLACGATSDENGIVRHACTDFGPDTMLASWCLVTAHLFACPLGRCRYLKTPDESAICRD